MVSTVVNVNDEDIRNKISEDEINVSES